MIDSLKPTLLFVLKQAVALLEKTTTDSAKLDAEVLLSHVLSQPRSYLLTWPDKLLTQQEVTEYCQLIERRQRGEPIAYIVGEKEFWSLDFYVAPSTLIPRPDTEVLVETVLHHHSNDSLSLLDLGTGTGAIVVALASERSNWQCYGVDLTSDAIQLATRNVQRHELTSQITCLQSDWFSALNDQLFDIIVSNPPYIDEQDAHLMQGDVRFEPRSALTSANHGLYDIELIVEHAKPFLTDGGSVYIEHGYDQKDRIVNLMKESFKSVRTFTDLNKVDRAILAELR